MNKVLIEKELGATPTITESEVVDTLVEYGFAREHVLFLKPSRTRGAKTPDIEIDHSARWEIKSLTRDGKYTLEHALRAGLAQSENVVIDIRKLSVPVQHKYTQRIEKEYNKRKTWKGAVVILKSQKASGILTFRK